MAGHRTTYNLQVIRQDYTYTVQQVADLLGTCQHTVLRWLKEGLHPLPATRPYLIYSKRLHAFLAKRQTERKHPCAPDQMFCMKCRHPRGVVAGTLTLQPTKNTFLRLMGNCGVCGTRMGQIVKPEKWGKTHPLFVCMQASVVEHNGAQQTQRACSVEKGVQLCLNLPP